MLNWALPLLHMMDPETAHRLTVRALSTGLAPRRNAAIDPILAVSAFGLSFPNPIGIAAGFDKNAEAFSGLSGLGFGFVEVGTVTPRPQPGNPRPRLFRLPENHAVINRNGFNNDGLDLAEQRLKHRKAEKGIVGANVGANKENVGTPEADYAAGVRRLAPLSDYITINVSSPNTPGLRDLQAPGPLTDIIRAVQSARQESGATPPLLLKIAPDLNENQISDIVKVALDEKIDGLIVSNTTIARPDSLIGSAKSEVGGLSGAPLMDPSTEILGAVYRESGGKIPIIGVGGISSGRDAYRKIRAGATLVQLYTALIYKGPGLVTEIGRDLARLLHDDGYTNLTDAVGADHRE